MSDKYSCYLIPLKPLIFNYSNISTYIREGNTHMQHRQKKNQFFRLRWLHSSNCYCYRYWLQCTWIEWKRWLVFRAVNSKISLLSSVRCTLSSVISQLKPLVNAYRIYIFSMRPPDHFMHKPPEPPRTKNIFKLLKFKANDLSKKNSTIKQ